MRTGLAAGMRVAAVSTTVDEASLRRAGADLARQAAGYRLERYGKPHSISRAARVCLSDSH